MSSSTPSTRIALLGAESSGKTTLAAQLAAHFQAQGASAVVLPEVLRGWCAAAGRTPQQGEQRGIAQAQARSLAQASHARWCIADTTPLMVAVYSDVLFGDSSLYPFALAHQRHYDLTLLTGLDLPWVADGLQRSGPPVQRAVDQRLRAALERAGIGYSVIYGHGEARLNKALNAIHLIAYTAYSASVSGQFDSKNQSATAWACEKCSDPGCELQLFRRLLR